MLRKLLPVLVLLLAYGAYRVATGPSGEAADAPVDWRREPLQAKTDRPPFRVERHGQWLTLTPRASFDAGGVVAAVEHYRFDASSLLSPADVALTWGRLPEKPYRGRISYSQVGRILFWETRDRDLDLAYIAAHAGNMHLIPSDDNLDRAVMRIGRGDEVRIEGLLVDAASDRGFHWKTSLSRTDTGLGACEVIWVEQLQIGDRLYE
jgi:hypothetical protein